MQAQHSGDDASLDQALSVFTDVRPRLFGMAYRMRGTAADAEDVVQYAWVRWQTTDRSAVVDPPAFLATVTTRRVAKFIASWRDGYYSKATFEWVEMNGERSVVFLLDGAIVALVSLSMSAEGIYQIMWYRHPGKLAAVTAAVKLFHQPRMNTD